ncbi:hypothetical protein [Actinoalloteichus sp. GBA129-24]|uniref:hypothetical protein n=1 Tax=Actinoalloteichus sp. GBA129-24 TaxID=1612551 RepID=UPI0009505410|nr:hypothetical protein [Actinoalloteichus sp. GBA129-24]APU22104.1 hypothetical protein UA75_20575 [Actinoalloteichus sp. GBA129-24]
MDHVADIIDSTHGILEEMADLIAGTRATITKTYQAGVTFIGNCAQSILNAAGSFAQNIANIVGAVCGAILQAGFIGATTDTINSALGAMEDHAQNSTEIKQRATRLRIPDPIPASATEPGNWQVVPK